MCSPLRKHVNDLAVMDLPEGLDVFYNTVRLYEVSTSLSIRCAYKTSSTVMVCRLSMVLIV